MMLGPSFESADRCDRCESEVGGRLSGLEL